MEVTRLRQAVVVATDRDSVRTQLQTHFGMGEPFVDRGVEEFGLHNYVFPIGDSFVEVVSPTTEGTTAGRFLQRNGGDCGYMVIFQVASIAACRDHLRAHGIRMIWTHDADDIASVHIHPQDIGGAIVSFDEPRPAASWKWGGPGWEERSSTTGPTGLAGVTLASTDPAALCTRWAAVLGVQSGSGATELKLPDGSVLSFINADDSGPRVVGITMKGAQSSTAVIARTIFSVN